MQLRSGRRLSPPRAPAPRGQRRHLPAPRRPEVEEDRISSLPDDLLLAVLARLDCAFEAARTSVLARRWRGLWTQLPVLVFFDYVPFLKIEASLAQVTRPSLDSLRMHVFLDRETVGRVSSLLRDIVEPLAPKKLFIDYEAQAQVGICEQIIMLPCFRSATTLHLCDHAFLFALPPAGSKFEALTTLELDCSPHLADLIPMCPSLRYLNVTFSYGDVIIHSPSLEELYVHDAINDMDYLWDIDIRAPMLKKATFDFDVHAVLDFRVSFSAPKVRQINWDLEIGGGCCFEDCMDDLSKAEDLSFPQKIPQLPLLPHHLSVLKLKFHMKAHAFAPLVLRVLQILPVTALNVEVELTHARQNWSAMPSRDCPCEEVNSNWRNEDIKLNDHLEAVTLVGFKGHDEEVDFLNVLFRCATDLKTMTVKVSNGGYKKISNICEQYPYVKCHVYYA